VIASIRRVGDRRRQSNARTDRFRFPGPASLKPRGVSFRSEPNFQPTAQSKQLLHFGSRGRVRDLLDCTGFMVAWQRESQGYPSGQRI